MRYLQTLLFTILLLFTASCATTPKVPIANKPKVDIKSKIPTKQKTLNLKESLKKIGSKVGDQIYIRIFKKEKELELWVKSDKTFKLCKTYPICTYSGDLGPKLKTGDKQSPEGFYAVTKKQLKPNSKYYLAFNIGFPNRYDKNLGRTGSYLMVHGGCTSSGCYAMKNDQIEEIYQMAQAALKADKDKFHVHIFPFKMTKKIWHNTRQTNGTHFG